MKILLIIISILLLLFIISQVYFVRSTNKTPTQPYKTILVEKDFEIRHYPVATMATIVSTAKSYKELGSTGFRKLAGYIFGGNEAKKKISMTTPVYMDINDSGSSMSFVMPPGFNKDNLPKPDNTEVIISTGADEYVGVIRFGGFASDEKIKSYSARLETALDAHGINNYGNFRFLGYNPPYQFINRKNEVVVSVHWLGAAKSK